MQSDYSQLAQIIDYMLRQAEKPVQPIAVKKASGGMVNMSDTTPDHSDGGAIIPAPFFAEGGSVDFDDNLKSLILEALTNSRQQYLDNYAHQSPAAPESN